MSPGASRAIRGSAIASAVVIAICATALSYSGLHELALRSGVEPRLAFVWPVIVDGLQVVGSLGVMYSTLSRISTVFPWFLMLLGTAISVCGNWIAAPPQVTAQVLHAASPVILALVLEELMRVARHKVSAAQAAQAAQQPLPTPVQTPAAPAAPAAAAAVPAPSARAAVPSPAPARVAPEAGRHEDRPHWPTLAAGAPTMTIEPAPETVDHTSTSPAPAPPRREQPEPQPQPVTVEPDPSAAPADTTASPALAPAPADAPTAGDDAPAGDDSGDPWDRGTIRERTIAYLHAHPDASAPDVYKALGTDPSTTRRHYNQIVEGRD